MKENKLTCAKDLFRTISQNGVFIRFLKEHRAFKAYDRLIKMPKFMGYHMETIRCFSEEIKNGKYFIARAFPWNDDDVQDTNIMWPLLSHKWIDLIDKPVNYDAHR